MKHETQTTHTTQPQLRFGDSPGGLTDWTRRNAGSLPASEATALTSADSHTGADTQAGSLRSDAENAAVDDLASLRAENERLKKQIAEQAAHTSLKDKLKQAGARTPKLLLEAAKHALEYTVAGELANASEIVQALMDKFPEQFGSTNNALATAPAVPSIDAGARPPSTPTLTREALAKMTPAQIAELNWDDVRRVLSSK